MNRCKCGSYAINIRSNGRDGSRPDLCDVCVWKEDALRWRHARKLLTVDDIEGAHGRTVSEHECLRADAPIAAAPGSTCPKCQCYGCLEYVAWLAPDSRCSRCTRLSPDEVQQTMESISEND